MCRRVGIGQQQPQHGVGNILFAIYRSHDLLEVTATLSSSSLVFTKVILALRLGKKIPYELIVEGQELSLFLRRDHELQPIIVDFK